MRQYPLAHQSTIQTPVVESQPQEEFTVQRWPTLSDPASWDELDGSIEEGLIIYKHHLKREFCFFFFLKKTSYIPKPSRAPLLRPMWCQFRWAGKLPG